MSELRLNQLVVENFRSVLGRCEIPLDGSITLVHGANGAGKTSLLSAIELAATGRVGFLDQQGGSTHSVLRNQDSQRGSVRLSLTGAGSTSREGAFELISDRVTGKAALSPAEQTYFLERSFLPQTALGRLLDSYTESGKQVDTALVRFVKSLIGLDDLDALIEGLHASGDRRRSRKMVPIWGRAAEEFESTQEHQRKVAEQLADARNRLEDSVRILRDLTGDGPLTDLDEVLGTSSARSRRSEASRAELVRLEGLQTLVDTIFEMRKQITPFREDEGGRLSTVRAEKAESEFENWKSGTGNTALAELNRIREEMLGLTAVTISQLTDGYKEATERAGYIDRQNAQALAAAHDLAGKIKTLDQQIANLDQEISSTEAHAEAIDVAQDTRVLIKILELVIPLSDSEQCPVCDEIFTADGSLKQHFTAKLHMLSENSSQLLAAEQKLKRLQSERLANVRQVVLLKSLPRPEAGESMDEPIRRLNGLSDIVSEGGRLRRNLQSTQASVVEVAAVAAEQKILGDRVAEVAIALGLSIEELPDANPEARLADEVKARIQVRRSEELQRHRELRARETIEEIQREILNWERELASSSHNVSSLRLQLSSAEARMVSSRHVLQTAEKTRSKLINEVFDQSLNSLWAQLFGRFAPSERFTPRFVKQTESSRSVDVRLETELPGGRASGSPGAMLSYGNTNSAALSLFMALHLSAPSELKWLIFDDPVQSMDDIHIANFAAVIRQLAFVHGRQVVIAIHQPELFDYLSLALAPSDANHSLVRVALDRGAGRTLAHVERVEFTEEVSLYREK